MASSCPALLPFSKGTDGLGTANNPVRWVWRGAKPSTRGRVRSPADWAGLRVCNPQQAAGSDRSRVGLRHGPLVRPRGLQVCAPGIESAGRWAEAGRP
jgi:hypothetical protein